MEFRSAAAAAAVRLAAGWVIGTIFAYAVLAGMEARSAYALLSGWWMSVVLLKGVKLSRKALFIALGFSVISGIAWQIYRISTLAEVLTLPYHAITMTVASIVVLSPLFAAQAVSFVEYLLSRKKS